MSADSYQGHVGLNGSVLAAAEARISPLGDGFMLGRGLFETVKVRDGRPAFFAEHAERLCRGAGAIGLQPPDSTAALWARCARVIEANGLAEGSLKVVLFADGVRTGELIATRAGSYPSDKYRDGLRLETAPSGPRGDPLSRLKTLNWLRSATARDAAREAGFDEALFVSPDGSALEGAATNLFVVAAGGIVTPPLEAGILPGIARAVVLGLLGSRASESTVSAALLTEASEAFVTNSLMGVMPVASIDRRVFPPVPAR